MTSDREDGSREDETKGKSVIADIEKALLLDRKSFTFLFQPSKVENNGRSFWLSKNIKQGSAARELFKGQF